MDLNVFLAIQMLILSGLYGYLVRQSIFVLFGAVGLIQAVAWFSDVFTHGFIPHEHEIFHGLQNSILCLILTIFFAIHGWWITIKIGRNKRL